MEDNAYNDFLVLENEKKLRLENSLFDLSCHILEWASSGVPHGCNPYSLEFVKLAEKIRESTIEARIQSIINPTNTQGL